MATIELQPIQIWTGSNDTEGRLVLFNGHLAAVLVKLDDDMHGNDRGRWFIEASFGSLPTRAETFATLEDLEAWIETAWFDQ